MGQNEFQGACTDKKPSYAGQLQLIKSELNGYLIIMGFCYLFAEGANEENKENQGLLFMHLFINYAAASAFARIMTVYSCN